MLFNSYEFIFIFLPLTLLIFNLIGKHGGSKNAIIWLVVASLFFYGWWNPEYLSLILFSIFFNYGVGVLLGNSHNIVYKKSILTLGVAGNLVLLGYFKYSNFFVESINSLTENNISFSQVILPLAISFFTFQQIAYLVDAYNGAARENNFINYCLFVTFFPQLIAGPIVHHKEMLPQFASKNFQRIRAENISVGLTIFTIGLFKKVVLADGVSVFATPVFNAAEAGVVLTLYEAWGGLLAYSFQIYFDFSGYSDMAIGLARMFGIRLPLNFNSPYKATSIIDFWRRWHITLSRFLQEYLYIPLGGNRKGETRRFVNIMITMLLGGLWHGAGWTFILWGGLHGMYLVINHGWKRFHGTGKKSRLSSLFTWSLTIMAVIVAWVPFRATSMEGVSNLFSGLVGLNGIHLSPFFLVNFGIIKEWALQNYVIIQEMFRFGDMKNLLVWLLSLMIISTLLPNTQQIMKSFDPALEIYKGEIIQTKYQWLVWKPTFMFSMFHSVILVISILFISKKSEFLYFQF
jgi:alginate O-acetyltransferase complex protein AlgI